MSGALKERIKNLIIFVLIITGILQVGILFGYQSQGTPTNFILGLFSPSSQISSEAVRERLFIPDRLILSDGEKSYWLVDKNEESHKYLWDEAQKDLRSVVVGDVSLKTSSENWGDLIEKKGIIIDFGYVLKPELLKWFLGIKETGSDLPDMFKLMIKPDIVDDNTGLLYIYGADDKVYVSDTMILGKAVNLDEVYAATSEDKEKRIYNTFRSANIDKTLSSPPDILYVNAPPKYWPYNEYDSKIPARIEKSEELATIVLGNEKDRYSKSKNSRDMIQFNYSNNIYRIYSDGCLTYQYLDTANSSEKGVVGDALLNAYKFVDRINQLFDSEASIILTDIEETRQGVFDISFDYSLNGLPIRLETDIQAGNGDKLKHAVNIQVDSKRVLKCEWLLRDIIQAGKNNYNDRFMDLMPLTGLGFDEMKINDVHIGYFIKSTSETVLKPTMLIDMKNETTIPIEMPVEEGD